MATRKPLVLQDGQLAQLQPGDTLIDVLYSLAGHNVSELTNDAGYLATETDPVWAAWLASVPGLTAFTNDAGYAHTLDLANSGAWDGAASWVSLNGYTVATEIAKASNWDGAASWVSLNGYTVATEIAKASNWDDAASWVALNGYTVVTGIANASNWDNAWAFVNYNGTSIMAAVSTVNSNSMDWGNAASWVNYNQTAVGYLLTNWGSTMNNSSNWDTVYGWYNTNGWSGISPSSFATAMQGSEADSLNMTWGMYSPSSFVQNGGTYTLSDARSYPSVDWGMRQLMGGWNGAMVSASWGTGSLLDGSNRPFLVNTATNGGFSLDGGYANYSGSICVGSYANVWQPNSYAFGQNLSLYTASAQPVLALGQNIVVSGRDWVTAIGVFNTGILVPSSNTVVLGGFSGSADEIWLTANTNGVYDKNGNQFVTGTPWLDLGNMNNIVDCNGVWGGYSEISVGIQLAMGVGQLMPGGTSSPTLDWVNKYLYGTWTDGMGGTYLTTGNFATELGTYNNSNWDSVYSWYSMNMWGGSSPSSFATAMQGSEADSLNMTWGNYSPSSFATAMQGSEADSLSMTWSGYSPSSFASSMGYNNSNWDLVYSTWGLQSPSNFLAANPTYLSYLDANGAGITSDPYRGVHISSGSILWVDGDSIYIKNGGSNALMLGFGILNGNVYYSMVSGPSSMGIDFNGGTLISSAGVVADWSTGTLQDGSGNAFVSGTPWTSAGYLTSETDPVVGAVTGLVKADGAGNIAAAAAGDIPFSDNSSGANWAVSAPTNTNDALNRIATALAGLLATPIP